MGATLSGISVRILDDVGNLLQISSTDAFGRYSFTGIASGLYLLRFVDLDGDHHSEYHDDAELRADATLVSASGGPTTIDGHLAQAATGTIDGTVKEVGTNIPLAGISVRLFTTGNVLLATRITKADGTYTFGQRDHGAYVERFVDVDASHVNEYHIDATAFSSATPITHAAWKTRINARLAPTPG